MSSEESLGAERPPAPDQVAGAIRYALSELGIQNAAHRFEDLCRYFARARIAANVIPATGPVGVGGDQGRDFETFRTYLTAELGTHGGFAGRASSAPLAFACTLQSDNIKSKIRADVKKICAGDVKPETIYAFVTQAVPVADRHALQEEMRATYDVGLEIFDIMALSEELASHDLFWIAERYLSLPASLAPPPPPVAEGEGPPDWYVEDLKRWRARTEPLATIGQLLDLRAGLRLAAQTPQLRGDLPFWLETMRHYCDPAFSLEVRQRGRYEVIVATVHGMQDLHLADDLVAAFFDDVSLNPTPSTLGDAGVVLNYVSTALTYGATTLSPAQVAKWATMALGHARRLADEAAGPLGRAQMLETIGHLGLLVDPVLIEPPTTAHPLPDVVDVREQLEVGAPEITRTPEMVDAALDIEAAMGAWRELARMLREFPLVPTSGLAATTELCAPMLVDRPEWREIVDALDAAIERSEGGAAVADRALGRAVSLAQANRIVDSIGELQRAMTASATGDFIDRALDCMLALGEGYAILGLPQAAKQFALAAAVSAHASTAHDVGSFVPHGFLRAAVHEYRAGNWASAMELIDIGLTAQDVLVDTEADEWAEKDSVRAIREAALIRSAALDLLPSDTAGRMTEILRSHGAPDKLLDIRTEWDENRWREIADDQLRGRPFDDLGATRIIRFAALGLDFHIECENDFRDVLAAERLAAALQICLVALRDTELCLAPQKVMAFVSTHPAADDAGQCDWDPESQLWRISLGTVDVGQALVPEDVSLELMNACVQILLGASLLPASDVMHAVEESLFKRGIHGAFVVGRPYDELPPVTRETFEASGRSGIARPLDSQRPDIDAHDELPWRDGPGPTYSRDAARESIEARYERLPPLIALTLDRLRRDGRFEQTVTELRARGWRDWHILAAVHTVAVQARLAAAGLNTAGAVSTRAGVEAARAVMIAPETPDDATLPLSHYLDVDNLERHLEVTQPNTLAIWDLEPKDGLDYSAAARVLFERYAYWDDDEPHPDPFGAPALADAGK